VRLYSNRAELSLGPTHNVMLVLDKSARTIEAITKEEQASEILVAEAFTKVNKEVYRGRLNYAPQGMVEEGVH